MTTYDKIIDTLVHVAYKWNNRPKFISKFLDCIHDEIVHNITCNGALQLRYYNSQHLEMTSHFTECDSSECHVIGASMSEPHTSELNSGFFLIYTCICIVHHTLFRIYLTL